MDDAPRPQLVFANRVLDQLIEHLFGGTMLVEPEDYLAIRLVFRWCGGSWELAWNGSIPQLELLKAVVTGWGKFPGRKKKEDDDA